MSDSHAGSGPQRPFDPILTNALRYTISADEYEHLHKYLSSRARVVQKRAPEPRRFEAVLSRPEDHMVATIRASVRLLILTYGGFKAWDLVSQRLFARNRRQVAAGARAAANPNLRIAVSFSLFLFSHRVLRRFLVRLRESLRRNPDRAADFWSRDPGIAALLSSRYTASAGAALAGLFLGVTPGSQLRVTIAIYALTRSVEFAYNAADGKGLIWGTRGKPSWVGTWMLVPFAYAQLLHAFVFDRDCFPNGGAFGRFILGNSPGYIQKRPTDLPTTSPWPTTFEIVDALAELSRSKWPPLSALTGLAAPAPIPDMVSKIRPLTGSANPSISRASCAILHPSDPSCLYVQIKYFLAAFPRSVRFFTTIYTVFAVLGLRSSSLKSSTRDSLRAALNTLSVRILRTALFVTGAIGTSWSSICLFSRILGPDTLATQRWFLGGFLGGLWAFLARETEKGSFLYAVRLSLVSGWRVGVKRGYWRGVRGGDVLLFCAAVGLANLAFEADPGSVRGGVVRKGLGVLRGDGWVDPVVRSRSGGDSEGSGQECGEEKVKAGRKATD